MTHKKFKCKFCNSFCSIIESKEYKKCNLCNVIYRVEKNKIESMWFETKEKNDIHYAISISIINNKSSIFRYKNIANNSYSTSEVCSFDEVINITPDNLEDKLKTYLLFL